MLWRARLGAGSWTAKLVLVMRSWTLLVVLMVVVAAACSGSEGAESPTTTLDSVDETSAPAATTTTPIEATTASVAGTSTTSIETDGVEVSEEVLAYLAAVEELLGATAYANAVVEDPDVFLATGFVFCERLTEGEEPDDILRFYVETLTGSDIDEADDDALDLAGTILGTAVGFLCPEHTTIIEQGF